MSPGIGWVSVEIDAPVLFSLAQKFRSLPVAMDEAGRTATEEATEYAKEIIMEFTPVNEAGIGRGGKPSRKPGTLRASWATRVSGLGPKAEGTIFNRRSWAAAVESGASARKIVPREEDGFLKWPGMRGGPKKRVWWPGFGGRHMAERGLLAAREGIFKRYNDAISRALRAVMGL
jgi:hypothetical protein